MMNLTRISAIFCAAFFLVVLPCTSRAVPINTVNIVCTGNGANEIISVWGGGLDAVDVYAGVYMLDKTGGTGEGKIWPNGPIGAFCSELSEMAPEITTKYDVFPLEGGPLGCAMGAVKADYIRELWGRFYEPSWVGSGPFTLQQNQQAAAFAAAVWEIIYEDLPISPLKWDVKVDGTPCTGGFRSEYVDAITANSWLHALDGTGPKADLRVFAYSGSQNYIAEVPEPVTIALLGIGGALSLLRRKRSAN